MKEAGLGIIINNKKILLAQRSSTCKFFPLHWGFPGGHSESNETPDQATIREVKEEINLDFDIIDLFHKFESLEYQVFYYLGKATGNIILQESEISDAKEFSYEELLQEKIAFNHLDILHMLRKKDLI